MKLKFNKMDEKNILEAIETKFNELKETSNEKHNESIVKFDEQLKELDIKSLKKEDLEEITKSFNELSENVQKMSERRDSNKKETLSDVFVKNQKNIDAFKNKESGIINMVIKADTLRTSVTSNPNGMFLNNIGQLPEPTFDFSDFFTAINVSPDSNGVIRYIDWDSATIVRSAAAIAEGATFPESTAKWIGYSLVLEKIGDSIPVSEEMLQDNTWTQSELQNFLLNNVKRVENQSLYNGNGTTPNISGVYTLSPTFDSTAYGLSSNAKTTTPDVMDLIKVLKKEIEKGQKGKYGVNVVFMSPEEYTATVLEKDSTGRRLREQLIELGVTIIPSSFVTDDQLVIGDGRFAKLYQIEDYNVEIDRNGTDFVDGMLTMRAKKRMALLIRQADRSGFLKVTSVAAAITAITA